MLECVLCTGMGSGDKITNRKDGTLPQGVCLPQQTKKVTSEGVKRCDENKQRDLAIWEVPQGGPSEERMLVLRCEENGGRRNGIPGRPNSLCKGPG